MTRRQASIKRLRKMFDTVESTALVWLEERSARCNLTIHGMSVLKLLSERGEGTLTRIGQQIAAPPSSMTGIAARLTESGYVERGQSQIDRRSVVLRITASGEDVLGQLRDQLDLDMDEIAGGISDERLEALADDIELMTGKIRSLAERLEHETRQARLGDRATVASD
ncbi:MAG: hypothetical protein AVDCRST_MAG33-2544 [uncultured Thermomicrobiales bacterium]|uniref:HTH marR-type domain-containing protein n=1 Tax=uncultured Thermomicrobiales bacterium TaxID=1645740 RepID=A0A6J4VDJ3_9BACT|nr:MAG: hypothetical protein AVDCRST_MAG33-2544 [uncultured Thermomicrobiales bacterium]